MKTRIKIIIIACLLVSVVIGIIWIDANQFSSKRLSISYENITSSQIPASFEGVSIALITDIQYGSYMNFERLESFIKKLNNNHPNIVLFAGDLFDTGITPSASKIEELTHLMSSIEADLGKFYVLGDFDFKNDAEVKNILFNSNFELIDGDVLRIHNKTTDYINLIGLKEIINNNNDLSTIFKDVNEESYTIALCHTPDIVLEFPIGQVDLLLAGHSHGSQIRYPFFGSYKKYEGSIKFTAGKHASNGTMIYVSSGLGTTGSDTRLFSNPQVIIFRLHSQ